MTLFERSNASDLAVIVIGGVLLLVSGIGIVRSASAPLRYIFEKIKSLMQPSPHYAEAKDEEVERIVKAKMQTAKLNHMLKGAQGFNLIFAGWTCMIILHIMRGTAARKSYFADFVQLATHLLVAIVTACPKVLTWRTIDVFYIFWIICCTLLASPLIDEPDKLLYRTLISDLLVFFFNVMRGSVHVVLPVNLLFVGVSCATVVQARQQLPIPAMYLVFAQLMFLSIFPACARQLEKSMESAIRQTLEVKAIKELLSAATALLRTCCDVVVECDADGLILCPALDLGGFLLRGPGNRNLQNTSLTSLISDEGDRKMFLRKLGEPRPSGVGLADVVHAQMRDGSNTLLKVELLTFEFRHMCGQRRFMIGIRQFSDAFVGRIVRPQPAPEGNDSDDDDVSMTSRPSSEPSDADQEDTVDLMTAPLLLLDSTKEALPIRGWSPSFQMKVGRLPPCGGLRELVQHGDDFAAWMDMAREYGSHWPNCRLTLNLRQGRVKATCQVLNNAPDEPVDHERVQVVFLRIRHDRCPSDGSRASRPHRNYKGTPVLRMPL